MSRTDELLEEILIWIRFSGMNGLRGIIDEFEDQDKLTYHHADGSRTTREIAGESSSSPATVTRRMQEWEERWLVTKNEHGRWEHLASLTVLDLEVPE